VTTGIGCARNWITEPLVLLLDDMVWSAATTLTEICPEGSTGAWQDTSLEERISAATVLDPKPLSNAQKVDPNILPPETVSMAPPAMGARLGMITSANGGAMNSKFFM
jgi:hypothetical protein